MAMAVWPQTYIPIIGKEQVAYMLQLFYSPESLGQQMLRGDEFIICNDNGGPVAFASWGEIEPGIAKLHKLYVLPGLHGKGIGKAMVAHIVSSLKKQGIAALHLNVNRYNYPAMAFYEKAGFSQFRDEDIEIGNGYFMNDHVLRLAIAPQPLKGGALL
jgi:ribosomal protein S18 acetylase RimI-like enzyme